jgi:hypothetical protein
MNIHLILNIIFITVMITFCHFNNSKIEQLTLRNRYLEDYKFNIAQTFKILEIELNSLKKKVKID